MDKNIAGSLQLFADPQVFLKDRRLSTVYHTDYNYQLKEYPGLAEWELRRKELREQVLVSSGLCPMPEKCKLNVKIFDRVEYDGFTVEKVIFESYPGFFVTGNLYVPSVKKAGYPAILNPHGHWSNGRFEYTELNMLPTRCANFARMGFVAFPYDMVGYTDSKQIGHKYGGFREELWGFGLFGLQLWNSIRCIDFLETLQYVDSSRIACTGASGGGTQTFFLAAVDDRIKAAIPVNMISTLMQGGCVCENAANLRIGTNNVELGALTAPRPMLMTGCTGDWTKNTPSVEYPYTRRIYELYGAGENIEYFYDDAEHNYNRNTREAVYRWLGKHFDGVEKDWKEQDIDFGDIDRLRIFPGNALPDGVRSVDELFAIQRKFKTKSLKRVYDKGHYKTKSVLTPAMKHIAVSEVLHRDCRLQSKDEVRLHGMTMERMTVICGKDCEQTPTVILGRNGIKKKRFVVMVHPGGMGMLLNDPGYGKVAEKLVDRGYSVVCPDVFLTGEYNRPYCRAGRDYTGSRFFTTFNRTDDALRIQDIVIIHRCLWQLTDKEINYIGLEAAGPWCLGAIPFLGGAGTVMADMSGFDIDSEEQYADRFYIPGFLGAGGFEACIRMDIPARLVIYNAEGRPCFNRIRKMCAKSALNQKVSILDELPKNLFKKEFPE